MTLIHCRRKLQLFHFQTVLENNSLQEIGLKFLSHLWIVLKMDHLRLSEDPRMFWQGNHSDHFLQLQPACSTILKLSRLKTWSISTDSLSRVALRMLANELKQENELHTLWRCCCGCVRLFHNSRYAAWGGGVLQVSGLLKMIKPNTVPSDSASPEHAVYNKEASGPALNMSGGKQHLSASVQLSGGATALVLIDPVRLMNNYICEQLRCFTNILGYMLM